MKKKRSKKPAKKARLAGRKSRQARIAKRKIKRAVPTGRQAKPKKAVKRVIKKSVKKAAKKVTKKAINKVAKKGLHVAYLGLGSNVGDREEYIEQAIFLLSKTPGIKIIKKSTNYETEPEGNTDQPQFLNAAIEVQTAFDPEKLLSVLHETENALGREREVEWGPRTIDLDILLYDDLILSGDKLQIPHSLLHERLFVLKPLSEIAPNAIHPALEKTITEIYDERSSEIGEKYDDELPGFKDIKKGTPDDYERW
ncbi:MAG: 2-amino-4-hydroxy-6-hydroxymethyldihydropteridine diphosphokinase [bacterium]